jgi:hypothetical protein
MSNVCFDKTFLILITVVIFVIILYKYNQATNELKYPPTCQHSCPSQQPTILRPNIKVNIRREHIMPNGGPNMPGIAGPPVDPVKVFDYRNVDDILTGPTRRPTRDQIGPFITNPLFNIYTQGPPDNYSWVGILLATDASGVNSQYGMLKLFGRQKYPNSNTWQYYVLAYNGGHDRIKLALSDTYRRELYDDDPVTISELNKSYKVKLNKDDWISYNPDII